MDKRIIVIEFDGATWDIIDPMISQGDLPNFEAMKKRSTYGEVESDYLGSPEIWTAIFTGKTMEKFGTPFWGVNRTRLRAKRIWEIAAERGMRIGVLHSLVTWPPWEVDGFIIPDIFAMGPETYPAKYQHIQKLYLSRHDKNLAFQLYYLLRSLLAHGDRAIVAYLLKSLFSSILNPQFLNTLYRRLMVITKLDHNLFIKLYKQHRPILSTYHLQSIDQVSHKYWQYMKKAGMYSQVIPDFYREADRFLGKVMGLLDEHTSLLVIADHGFTEFTDGRGKFELNVSKFRELFSLDTSTRIVRFGDAFLLNLGDRQQKHDASWIVEELASAQLRSGGPLFGIVKKIEPNIHFQLSMEIRENRAPMEEVITFRSFGQVAFRDLLRKKNFMDSGIHQAGRGIFIICGKHIVKDNNLKKVKIFDITPTLLTMLDLPIGKDMDGDFDRRWFTPQALESIKPQYLSSHETEKEGGDRIPDEAYDEKELSDLEERLKMLGYL